MEKHRYGEKNIQSYRSSRFYSVASEWFFSVRETEDQGPFINKTNAEEGLRFYISDCEHFKSKKIKSTYLTLV